MIGRLLLYLSAITFCFLGISDDAGSTTKNVDIHVTHSSGPQNNNIISLHLSPPISYCSGTCFPNFIAGSGSANRVIGTLSAQQLPLPSTFSGTWSISGWDAALFTVNSATGEVRVGSADLPVDAAGSACRANRGYPCYAFNVTATQSGIANSPFSDGFTLYTVASSPTPPSLTVDKDYANPGDTVTVTVHDTPNATGIAYVQMLLRLGMDHDWPDSGHNGSGANGIPPAYQYVGAAGVHDATLTFTIPTAPTDHWQHFSFALLDPSFTVASAWVNVPPASTPQPPTAPNPGFAAPFTPAHTLTVCRLGCDYTYPNAAYNAAAAAGWDNVLITVQAGVYAGGTPAIGCLEGPSRGGLYQIPHVWIKGIGGGFAHLICSGNVTLRAVANNPTVAWNGAVQVFENLELSDNSSEIVAVGTPSTPPPASPTLQWFRNVYIHDSGHSAVFGNAPLFDSNSQGIGYYSLRMENVHIARGGSGNGPQHNMYIEANDFFDFLYSISESAMIGHELKSRAWQTTINCSKLLNTYNDPNIYGGSQDIDFSEGYKTTLSNSVIAKNASAGSQLMIKWSADREDALDVHTTEDSYFLVSEGNLYIAEQPSVDIVNVDPNSIALTEFYGVGDMWGPKVPPSRTANDIFVGPYGGDEGPGLFIPEKKPFWYFLPSYANTPNRTNNTFLYYGSFVKTSNPNVIFGVTSAGTTASSEPAAYATATDTSTPQTVPGNGTRIVDGTAQLRAYYPGTILPIIGDQYYATRADAGIAPLAGYIGHGDDPVRFPIPAACGSRPTGNVAIP